MSWGPHWCNPLPEASDGVCLADTTLGVVVGRLSSCYAVEDWHPGEWQGLALKPRYELGEMQTPHTNKLHTTRVVK